MLDFQTEIYKRMTEVVEREDDFIISHFYKYAEDVRLVDSVKFPKVIVKRALDCFCTEHRDEFDALMAKYNGEVTK